MTKSLFKAVQMLMLLIPITAGDHIGDPEPEVTWTPPSDESKFESYRIGENYTGLLYAGQYEFNWLVDIRTEDNDQESWSVGNLVSSYHVLTTFRAVDILQERSNSKKETLEPSNFRWSKDVYRQGSDIRIYYCRDFLWADGRRNKRLRSEQDFELTGYRSAKEIIRHLNYNSSDLRLLFDVAFIVLSKGIPPFPPRLGFMPTGYDYAVDQYTETVKLDPTKDPTYESPICYVASFGRNSVNNKEYYTLDYKIKYRVYITRWKACADRWKYICSSEDCDENPEKYGNVFKVMCLQTRAKVGTVCDHDKGAPVVCRGQVIGLVTRGAEFRFCNNQYKIPFVAEKIYHYKGFLEDSLSYAVTPVPMIKFPTTLTTSGRPRGHQRGPELDEPSTAPHQRRLPILSLILIFTCPAILCHSSSSIDA